jgi:hypothetical protein
MSDVFHVENYAIGKAGDTVAPVTQGPSMGTPSTGNGESQATAISGGK